MTPESTSQIVKRLQLLEQLGKIGLLGRPDVSQLLTEAFTFNDAEALDRLGRLMKLAEIMNKADPNPARPCVTPADGLDCEIPIGMQENGYPFGLALSQLHQNLLIFGPTGGGKTAITINFIENITPLAGAPKLLVLSVKQDFAYLARRPGWLVFTAEELRVGLFAPAPIVDIERAVERRIQDNAKINRQTLGTMLASQLVMAQLQEECLAAHRRGEEFVPPTGPEFMAFLERIAPRFKRGSFEFDFFHRFHHRFANLLRVFPKVFNVRVGHSLPEILGKWNVVLEFSEQSMETETLEMLLTWILCEIFTYRSSRGLRTRTPAILVVVDEADFLFSSARLAKAEDELMLAKVVTRGREFGINFVAAAQRPTQVARYLKANAATQMVVGGLLDEEDKRDFCRSTGLNSPEVYDLIQRLNALECLIRDPRRAPPILVEVAYPEVDKHISLDDVRRRMAPLIRELPVVVADPLPKEEPPAGVSAPAGLNSDAWLYALNVQESPDASIPQRQKLLNLSREEELRVRRSLEEMGFLRTFTIPRNGPGRPAIRMSLTAAFYKAAGVSERPGTGKGSPLHQRLQALVAERFQRLGHEAQVEANINGKSVDVALRRSDREIWAFEIATTAKNEISNIIKDILVAGAARVIVGCLNHDVLRRVKRGIEELEPMLGDKTEVDLISKFL